MTEQLEQTTELALTPEQLRQMETSCKDLIKIAEALERLQNHADFKLVFLEEYVKKEPSRIALLLAEQSWNMDTPEKKSLYREDLNERLIGIGRFHEYMRKVYAMADRAQNELNSLAEVRF